MPALRFGFDQDDLYDLCALIESRDSARITEWLQSHVHRLHDMHALLEALCRVIYAVWPKGLTKDVTLGEGEFWAMSGDGADSAARTAAQMVTASLNGDWDNLTAIIRAILGHPEEFHGAVTAYIIAAVGDGLVAADLAA